MTGEAWAFADVALTQLVTYLLGRRDTRRVDSTDLVQQLVTDMAEVKTDLRNVRGWVGSIDRRLSAPRRRW